MDTGRVLLILLGLAACSKAEPPSPAPAPAPVRASAHAGASATIRAPVKPPTDVEKMLVACMARPKEKCECVSGRNTQFKYTDKYASRAHNIAKVAEKLNGSILWPGKEWSFNETVGPRTAETGFKMAPIYFAGLKQQGMGGGTCQASSTVYESAMFAHLTQVLRVPHTRPSDYTLQGMDATVDYGTIDLILKNPYSFPLYLEANISEWAVEEEEPPGTPPMKSLSIFFCTHVDFHPPEVKVRTVWRGKKPVPFETTYIDGKYHRGEPKREQRGKDGRPGRRIWVYYENGKKIEAISVRSNYKPVTEVWIKHPDWDAGVQDGGNTEAGEPDAAGDSGSETERDREPDGREPTTAQHTGRARAVRRLTDGGS